MKSYQNLNQTTLKVRFSNSTEGTSLVIEQSGTNIRKTWLERNQAFQQLQTLDDPVLKQSRQC